MSLWIFLFIWGVSAGRNKNPLTPNFNKNSWLAAIRPILSFSAQKEDPFSRAHKTHSLVRTPENERVRFARSVGGFRAPRGRSCLPVVELARRAAVHIQGTEVVYKISS